MGGDRVAALGSGARHASFADRKIEIAKGDIRAAFRDRQRLAQRKWPRAELSGKADDTQIDGTLVEIGARLRPDGESLTGLSARLALERERTFRVGFAGQAKALERR